MRQLIELLGQLRTLDSRRRTILNSTEAQDKLTPELKKKLLAAETRSALEDLYQPYKPKRRTRAGVAREKGLQELADLILKQAQTPAQIAAPFLNENVPSAEDALSGARDIVAEIISDHPGVRQQTREKALRWGLLQSKKIKKATDERGVYQTYYEYSQRADRVQPHQVLAVNRGEAEKILRVRIDIAERDWQRPIRSYFRPEPRSPLAHQLELASEAAAERLLLPAIERDVRRALTEQAEKHAIGSFAANLRALLNQPPLAGHTGFGLDPGYRTGCKVAVVDSTGKVLETTTIYPHKPQGRWNEALRSLATLVRAHQVTLIAVGNGTASRESEQLAAELIHELGPTHEPLVHYLIVNEAGASVYSASPLARAELPDLDVSIRGAVSIIRRVQDPLAELVKIAPKSIGVGMYQHDVDQAQLVATLAGTVESVVNSVGVDVNTASPALLSNVAGVGPKLAERIVAFRDDQGLYLNREALKDVPGLGPKAFEQAAGFLRVRAGDNPLDASAIHPESYAVAEAVLQRAGLGADAPLAARERALQVLQAHHSLGALAAEFGTGASTLQDIFEQLLRPGRDPRAGLPAPILRSDVLSMEDLQPGLHLRATVRNVVDFGAFVDIGVKRDGLLHRSHIPRGVALQVGDVIDVEIVQVKPERNRISLGWFRES